MAAFQPYAGAYEHQGDAYNWRCYATARVYEVRRAEHAPAAKAPQGRKWVSPVGQHHEQEVCCLVDAHVEEFSQILLQVQGQSPPVARPARERVAAGALA